MPAHQISATVREVDYIEFEAHRRESGQKRSEAISEAIRVWNRMQDDYLIAEGCRESRKEDEAIASASKSMALKAMSQNL